MMHCVAFIVDATSTAFLDEEVLKKFQDIRKKANERGKAVII